MFEAIQSWLGISTDQEEGETQSLSELRSAASSLKVSPDASHLVGIAAGWVSAGVRRARPSMADDFELPELVRLLNRPNSVYGGADMLDSLAFECLVYGTSYARLVRGDQGLPERIHYIPSAGVELDIDGARGLQKYRYRNALGNYTDVGVDDMLVFKWRINPSNQYVGVSPFDKLKNVIYIDEESVALSGSILYNTIIGMFISPESVQTASGGRSVLNAADIDKIDKTLTAGFAKEKRGALVVSPIGLNVENIGDAPNSSNLIPGHNLVEERVCAAIKVHPSVLGLGTGLQSTRVGATAAEYRRESWISGILPMISIIESEINTRLVPEFTDSPDARFALDVSHIPDLRPTVDDVLSLVDGGVISAEAAAGLLGYEYTGAASDPDPDGEE